MRITLLVLLLDYLMYPRKTTKCVRNVAIMCMTAARNIIPISEVLPSADTLIDIIRTVCVQKRVVATYGDFQQNVLFQFTHAAL